MSVSTARKDAATSGDHKKILLVDNNPEFLQEMTHLLEKAGHQVLVAANGLAALEKLESLVPDVIFTDLVMPRIGGDKLCRIIRSIPKFSNVYIVLISATAAEEKIPFSKMGADACIAKGPFSKISSHLYTALKMADQRGRKQKANQKIIGIEDIYQREVTRELLTFKKNLDHLLDSMEEGILELTHEARIIYANNAATTLFGAPEEKLLAAEFFHFFDPDQQAGLRSAVRKAEQSSKLSKLQDPVLLNGRPVNLHFLPIKNKDYRSIITIVGDVSEPIIEETLQGNEQCYRQLFNNMSSCAAVYRMAGESGTTPILVDMNQTAECTEGIARSEVIGKKAAEVFPDFWDHGVLEVCRRVWRTGRTEHHTVADHQGREIRRFRNYCIYKLPQGELVTVYDDLTDRKRDEENLAFEAELNQAVAKLSRMLISADSVHDISEALLSIAKRMTDSPAGFVGYVDPNKTGYLVSGTEGRSGAARYQVLQEQIFQYELNELYTWVSRNKKPLLTNDPVTDLKLKKEVASHLPLKRFLSAPALLGSELMGQIVLANSDHDYTDRDLHIIERLASLYALALKQQWAEERITQLAHYDQLTGLVNRHLFEDRLEQALIMGARQNKKFALLFIDLDNFKEINDSLGHKSGDLVLQEVAKRLIDSSRASDTVARIGGDEFVLILQNISKKEDAKTVARKIDAALGQPLILEGEELAMKASIGTSVYPYDGKTMDSLLKNADESMYRVKKRRKRTREAGLKN
ncbi:MAG: diguanylate cyclase [Deltaproteobacteria bacterium]|jgi:diguanylate cyclase (GGDEF)-like protein